MSSKQKVFFLVVLAFLTRFIGFNWGNNYFFHPDENNMAQSLSQLSSDNLNPNFYAYGQFPLYLGFFSLKAVGLANTFSNSIFILRFYSAFFSVLSLGLIYLITQKIFSQSYSILAIILTIFNPGLIQLAHFGTTESLLILIFLLEIYLALIIYQKKDNYWQYSLAGIFAGIALATKISSLIFLGPIILVSLMKLIKKERILSVIFKIFLLIIFAINFYLISSPYNVAKSQDFFSAMKYETSVAIGESQVFYTTQFKNTSPYIFQIIKVFPYSSGIFQFIFAFIGLILLLKNWKLKNDTYLHWFIILIPSLVYFLYFGQVFAKWTRFISPLFFLFPLLSTYFVSSLRSKFLRLAFIILALLPGLYFIRIYFYPDVRVSASEWITKNISVSSTILSEGGNVVNLPLSDETYQVINYDFYNSYPDSLSDYLLTSDYIIVPSRRVFKNYKLKYHQHLFDGTLGYKEIKKITPHYDFLLNSENAEETWSVFGHPTIRIFKKDQELNLEQYENLL